MAAVDPLKPALKHSSPSTLAFARDVPYLAAGTTTAVRGTAATLTILGATPDVGLRDLGAEFVSPAPFCRLSWSMPVETAGSSSSSYTGLLAGGLCDGGVAVWNPREKLRDPEGFSQGWISEPKVIEDHFPSEDPTQPKWACPFKVIDDYYAKPSHHSATPATGSSDASSSAVHRAEMLRDLGWGTDLDSLYFPPATLHAEDPHWGTDMVAYLSKHTGPVKGLSFNTIDAYILASGATYGRVMIWDLAHVSRKSYPMTECYGFSDSDISYLSWSPYVRSYIASATNDGLYLWDVRAKSPLVRYFEATKGFSSIKWSPADANTMIAGTRQTDSASVLVFDIRSMSHPVNEFCHDSKGVLSLSWCPNTKMIVGSTTSNKILVWEGEEHKAVWEDVLDTEVSDVQWNRTNRGCFAVASEDRISLYNLAGRIGGNC